MDISNFLKDVKNWAKQNDMINSVILVGSHARGEEREDSDIDLEIITTTPSYFIDDKSFIDTFGKAIKTKKEKWGRVTSIRVWYDNGLEVEFGITTPIWVSKPLDEGTIRILSDGYKVIVDKKNYFKDII